MIAVLVACADSRRDIFDTCFAHSERIWADCRWPRYVGLNTPGPDLYGFKVIAAPPLDWCKQVAAYLDVLPDTITHVLLMVEDVLFMAPVDDAVLNYTVARAIAAGIRYLRLVPVRRNLIGRFVEYWNWDDGDFRKINRDEPYYASTEMVIWERNYLRQMLDYKNDAWSFENMVTGVDHYATWEPMFDQHQIVSKGRWARVSPKLLAKAGLAIQGNRPLQTARSHLRGLRENLSFNLFGFTSFRIKRKFR